MSAGNGSDWFRQEGLAGTGEEAMGSELELDLDLGSVCRRLDQGLLRYLEDVERLGERRERLERLMEQGWFSLSKARYSMGNKLVSSLQYGPEMVPLARVDVSQKQDGHHGFSIKRVDSSEVQTAGLNEDKHLEIEEIGPKVLAESPQVRQRKSRREQAGVEEEWRDPMGEGTPRRSEGIGEGRESPARGTGRSASLDPLRWFGILVPQSLKFAQTSFQEVMELAAEVATLQNRLVSGREQYRHLLQQKHKLVQPHTA